METFDHIVIDRNSDETHHIELLRTASLIHNRKQDSLEWLKWKYFGSPFGDCIVVMAYSARREFAGEVSFGRYEFVDGNKVIKAIYSYQTMVHPTFQRRGLFGSLTKQAIEVAREEQVDVVFNFPNHNSYRPFLKLGFTPLNGVKHWVSPGSRISFLRQFNPLSLRRSFVVNRVDAYSDKTVATFREQAKTIQPHAEKGLLYPNKSYDFLKWRYFSHAMHHYEIITTTLGWAIVRVGKRGSFSEAQIMDVFPHRGFSTSFLKAIKRQIGMQLKVGLITFLMSEAHPLNKNMIRAAFLAIPNKLKFCVYPLSAVGERYLSRKRWAITAAELHRY